MKETRVTMYAPNAMLHLRFNRSEQLEPPNSAVRLLPQNPNTLRTIGVVMRCHGTTAVSAVLGQVIPHGVIIAGAVNAELKCSSGWETSSSDSAMAVTRSSTLAKITAGTAGTRGRNTQRAADCLCRTTRVGPGGIHGLGLGVPPGKIMSTQAGTAFGALMLPLKWRRHLRSGKQCHRRRRLIAASQQRRQGRSQPGHSISR